MSEDEPNSAGRLVPPARAGQSPGIAGGPAKGPAARRIAIYDLDRTLTARPTFTPFLIFAAARLSRWRLVLLPAWLAMMIGHKLQLLDRTDLKRRGMRLMLGRCAPARLQAVAEAFARSRLALLHPGAQRAVAEDRRNGWTVVIATAAYAFYAAPLGRLLAAEEVIASPWENDAGVPAGPNCYGPEKLARVTAWFDGLGVDRALVHVRAVSDSFADAPLLDWADEAWFVTARPRAARAARQRGWTPVDFSR